MLRELLIILLVVLLVFGTKKLRSIGSDLGGAVKGFKKAAAGQPEPDRGQIAAGPASQDPPDAEFPEVAQSRPAQSEVPGRR